MEVIRIRGNGLLVLASLFIIVAGMRAAADLLEPLLLATFFSIVCAPAVGALQKRGLPEWLSVSLVLVMLLLALLLMALGLGASINGFLRQMPEYQAMLNQRVGGLLDHLTTFGIDTDLSVIKERLDVGAVMQLAGRLVGRFGSVLGNVLLIVLTVAFILLEAARFPAKLRQALGERGQGSLEVFERFAGGVKQYLAIKSLMSLGTGLLIAAWLWVLEVDYPLLWGSVAFLFNYIPNIGSFLAAIPAVMLAWVLHGSGVAVAVAAGYGLVNMVFGNFLEPRLMGRSLGLSTLVVFLSLVLWGWVLGPVGMVLSVPLTMILRIALDSSDNTRWLAVLLGPEVEQGSQSSDVSPDSSPNSGA